MNFAASDVLGNHDTTTAPTVDIVGGGVTTSNNAHVAFDTLILRGTRLNAGSDNGMPGSNGWGSFNFNGTVTSYDLNGSDCVICKSDPNATITLQSGDMGNPTTTFDVEGSRLSVEIPMMDGIDSHTTNGNWLQHATNLTKTGPASWPYRMTTPTSGQTNVNGGGLWIFNVNSLNRSSKTVIAGGGFVRYLSGVSGTVSESFDLNGSPDDHTGALQVADPGSNITFTGPITLVTTAGIGGGDNAQEFDIRGGLFGSGGLIRVRLKHRAFEL